MKVSEFLKVNRPETPPCCCHQHEDGTNCKAPPGCPTYWRYWNQ